MLTVEVALRDARARLTRLTPGQALRASQSGGLIVDIRSEVQRAEQGVVPSSHFIPRNVLEWRADPACEHRDPLLARVSGPLVLMCAQGYQSSLAAAALKSMGVDLATDMIGGFEAWLADGLPVSHGDPLRAPTQARALWDGMFERGGREGLSWHERSPEMSLAMIDALDLGQDDAIVDVGGGASGLAGALVGRGFTRVTVVDVSGVALRAAREALGASAHQVEWVRADVLDWRPRSFDLWHDRAVFHFLTDPAARDRYVVGAGSGVREGGYLVIGTFAEDGPRSCSGLPVARYDARALEAQFRPMFSLVDSRRQTHRTPGGAEQAFTWATLRRAA